ncbi:unnamed protein product [Gordionus sp. m RMFG-2023]
MRAGVSNQKTILSMNILEIKELKNLRRTLKVEANVEFQLNSIGSWIEICLLPLYNRPYNCLEFTNANITINVTNNLSWNLMGILDTEKKIHMLDQFA